MSSLVLARKYRPRSFGEMVGQEHVVQALANALASQRLHHAYLFTGTRGVGKTTVSRILAKSLNCTGPDGQGGITAEPCGVCRSCTEIDADRFIDYVEMDAASNRGIDEIRDLLERAAYKPAVGRFKVFMIDEVHQLTKDSFNALLKTLEEPPEYLKFVLATTDPEKVLPTVLSRCLQFNLRPMAPDTVLGRLQQVLDAEQVPAEPGALRLIARAARGSMRDALSLADQAIAFGAGSLAEAGVRQMLGSVGRGHVFELIEALAEGDGARVVAGVDALRAAGGSAEGTLEEMAAVLQQMAVLQAVPAAQDADDPEAPAIAALAARLPADETQLLYSIVLHGRGELALAPDEYGGLVMVLLRLLAFRPAGAARPREPAGAAAPARAAAASDPIPVAGASGGTGAAPLAARAPREAAATPPTVAAPSTAGPQPPAEAPPRSESGARPAAPAVPLARSPASASVAVPAGAPRPRAAASSPGEPAALRAAPGRAAIVPPWEDEPPPVDEWSRGDADLDRGARRTPPPTTASGASGASGESAGAPQPAAAPGRAGSAQPAPEPVRTPLGDRWSALVAQLVEAGAVTALARELALQSECVAFDEAERRIVLRVERESLRHPGHAERLQSALAGTLGRPVQLEVEAGAVQDTPARRDAADRARRQREAEARFGEDPLVQQLTAQFSTARVVPGSIKPL